jgi:hypothetical protein
MNELYLWVGGNASAPAPITMIRDVHPFGKEVGNVTIQFSAFTALKSVPDSVFDLGTDMGYACASPQPSSSCQSAKRVSGLLQLK